MNKGEPPGCWVAPELLEKIQSESTAPDKGQALRLERAARMVRHPSRTRLRRRLHRRRSSGRPHSLDHETRRSSRPALGRARRRIFIRSRSAPSIFTPRRRLQPRKRSFIPRLLDAMGRLFPVNRDGKLRRVAHINFQLDRQTPGSIPRPRTRRIRHQVAPLRLPGLRQLRPRPYGIRLPADLPEKSAQRPVRRHLHGPMRSGGQALHLDFRIRAREIRRASCRTDNLYPSAQSSAERNKFLDQLFPQSRQSPRDALRKQTPPLSNHPAGQTAARSATLISDAEVIAATRASPEQKANRSANEKDWIRQQPKSQLQPIFAQSND